MTSDGYHSECDVLACDLGVGGSEVSYVLHLSVVLRPPLDTLLSQQPYLIIHVHHPHVELVVLQQEPLGRRRQSSVRLAPVFARYLSQVHQDVLLQPTTHIHTPLESLSYYGCN